MGPLLVPIIGALAYSANASQCTPKESDVIIPKAKLLGEINTRMENLRKQNKIRKILGNNGPEIQIRVEGKGKEEVHVLEISNYDEQNIWNILSKWIPVLGNGTVELHSIVAMPGGGQVISFVSSQGKSSLVVTAAPGGTRVSLFKDKGFTGNDLDGVLNGYAEALSGSWQKQRRHDSFGHSHDSLEDFVQNFLQRPQLEGDTLPSPPTQQGEGHSADPLAALEGLGVTVYTGREGGVDAYLTWEALAGYNSVKQEIKDSVLTPLLHPEVYDTITKYTREAPMESNRPKAVLLEGPPGTGKTLTARILAREANRPMVHLPVEAIASKWYGDSEKKLSQVRVEDRGGA